MLGNLTQTNRFLRIDTPLGPDAVVLSGIRGREAVSELFQFQLDLIADRRAPVSFAGLLGRDVSVRLSLADGTERFFHGLVRRLVEILRDKDFVYYRAEMAPRLWLWTKRAQSRIFQQLTVPDILQQVLAGLRPNVVFDLRARYYPRDYCVQYRESDFAFASRLMEEEGIFITSTTPRTSTCSRSPTTWGACRTLPGRPSSSSRKSKAASAKASGPGNGKRPRKCAAGSSRSGTIVSSCRDRAARSRTSRPGSRGCNRSRSARSATRSNWAAARDWKSTTTPADTPSASTASITLKESGIDLDAPPASIEVKPDRITGFVAEYGFGLRSMQYTLYAANLDFSADLAYSLEATTLTESIKGTVDRQSALAQEE